MEQILKVVHDNKERRDSDESRPIPRTDKRQRSSSRSKSAPSTSEIANLADDVAEMKQALKQLFRFEFADLADEVADIKEALKQLQEEVRQGPSEKNVQPVDQALQSKATTLWQAVEEIKQIQEDKFRLYDTEINKFSMGVTELRKTMDSSRFDSASETKQGDTISSQQLSEELKRVARQQEELSDRLELLGAVASKEQDVGPNDTSLTPVPGEPQKKDASGGGKVARTNKSCLIDDLEDYGTLGNCDHDTSVGTNEASATTIQPRSFHYNRASPQGGGVNGEVKATSSKFGEDQLTYEKLHGSTWNASVLMFTKLLNLTINLEIGVLLFLTMLCQTTMVLIVLENMTQNDFTEINTLSEWRLNIAGKVEYMEPVTQRSLGSRVCDPAAHSSLELSYKQAFLVDSLNEYFGIGTFTGIAWGPVMCILAIFSWHMCVLTELQSAFGTFIAFLFLPRGTTLFEWDDGGLSVLSVSKTRLLFVTLTVFCRIALALLLMWSGTRWLVATKGIENLLLNNVALEIVLDMDERIFETLAPCLLKQTLDEMQPLPLERIRHAWKSHLSQLALLATFFFAVGRFVVPEIGARSDALDVLCDGKIDFVTSIDAAGYLYWVSLPRQNATRMYQEAVALIVEEQPDARYFELPTVSGSIYSLNGITGQTAADRGLRWNVNCLDLFRDNPEKEKGFQDDWLEQRFIEVIGDPSFRSCRDLPSKICHDDSALGMRVRQLCSDSCGCRSAISPFPMATHLQGCPSSCHHLPDYSYNPEVIPCSEKPSSESWQAYAGNLTLVTSLFRTQRKFWSAFAANFSTMGCPALVEFVNFKGWSAWDIQYNLCLGTGVSNPLRGFAAMCPTTCTCIADPLACPAGCPIVTRK